MIESRVDEREGGKAVWFGKLDLLISHTQSHKAFINMI